MPDVKKIIVAVLGAVAILALFALGRPAAGPAGPARRVAVAPARADLAEAVFAMTLARAAEAGLPLAEPVTLCQACVAAHLGLPGESVRERCGRACGLP